MSVLAENEQEYYQLEKSIDMILESKEGKEKL